MLGLGVRKAHQAWAGLASGLAEFSVSCREAVGVSGSCLRSCAWRVDLCTGVAWIAEEETECTHIIQEGPIVQKKPVRGSACS